MSKLILKHLKIIAPFNAFEKVVVTDIEELCRKIGRIKNDGIQNLQFVSDFDFTLTRFHCQGVQGKTSVTLAQVTGKGKEREQEVKELIDLYLPIEHSDLVSESVKAKFMKEWWFKSSSMLIQDKLKDSDLESIVLNSQVYLRHSITSLLNKCRTHSIPFTIVSAGFGNIIQKFFDLLLLKDSVQIYSNFLLENRDNELVHRTEPFIVSIEKSDVMIGKTRKENFIIMGDMASDSWVVEKIPHETVIKIGFLNVFNQQKLKSYEKFFDLIILNDGNLVSVEYILDVILGNITVERLIKFLQKVKYG